MVAAHLEVGRTLVVQRRVVADRVEEDVELRARVLARELRREVALLVVEDVVGAEGRDELARGRRTGRDDGGTVGLGELQEGKEEVVSVRNFLSRRTQRAAWRTPIGGALTVSSSRDATHLNRIGADPAGAAVLQDEERVSRGVHRPATLKEREEREDAR